MTASVSVHAAPDDALVRIAALNETGWMTIEEAATYMRCGERYLREQLAHDRVPHVMFAGKALFHPERLDAWLLSMEISPLEGEERSSAQRARKGECDVIEADMERLIRDYPQEFFDEELKLVSQQESFRAGITDLIFEDEHGDLLVVELKRGVLQREHIAQIIDYLGDVEQRYTGRGVELMIVANIIPPQRRTKLERLGVNFKEISEAKLREVAGNHGVSLSETNTRSPLSSRHERQTIEPGCARERVSSLIAELIDYGERFVSGLGRNLKTDVENSGYDWLSAKTFAQLSRWCHPNRYTSREQWVQPRAHEISQILFGRVISRTHHPSYGN